MYLTTDLTGEGAENDCIVFAMSVHYNSVPFSSNLGVDPNAVNETDAELLELKFRNVFAELGYKIKSISNNYGRINIKLTNGKELNVS